MHEGAPSRNISPDLQLRRSEMAGRIAELVPKATAEKVAAIAIEDRESMKLRHTPLLLVREMARHKTHRALVSETLAQIIQRADELAEFVAIYWKDGRVPLSCQVKKGLTAAFPKLMSISSPNTSAAGRSNCGTCSSSASPSRAIRRRPTFGRGWSREAWRGFVAP